MGYLPTPTEIVNFWHGRKRERRAHLAEYLDAVAKEATDLAKRWNELATELEQALGKYYASERAEMNVIAKMHMEGTISIQNPTFDKIVLHYRSLSTVIGGLISKEVQEEATNALGAIIQARTELKDLMVSACKMLETDSTLSPAMFEKIKKALGALHQEAAALDVLAKVYKAKA